MNRRDSMLERLPPVYGIQPGTVLHQLVALAANHQAAYDEDMQRVQRSHWIGTALDRDDLAKLGALFEVPMMPWEPEGLYRTRLTATVAARLRGAVTRDMLEFVIVQILNGVVEALGVRYVDVSTSGATFHAGPARNQREAAFVEFPPVVRRSAELVERQGLLRPLDKVTLTNKGLQATPLQAAIRGVAGGLSMVPVLVNLRNGMVLAYVGDLRCGQELRLGADEHGKLTARLGDDDAQGSVYTGTGFAAGAKFTPVVPDPEPQPLMLERGENVIWFFPLALFDQKSLGSAVFGMPESKLEQGRFGSKSGTPEGTSFDDSLFEQPAAVSLDLWWEEARPASFRFEIPAGAVARKAAGGGDAHQDRERLFALLGQTVELMRAAGVEGRVEARPLRERQLQDDRGRAQPPVVGAEEMRMEARLSALSALFDWNAMDGSRFG